MVGQLEASEEASAAHPSGSCQRRAALLPGGEALAHPPPRMPCRWPQEGVQAAFRSLFPAGAVDFELPVLEDLLVQEPFHLYAQYLDEAGLASWEPQAPVVAQASKQATTSVVETRLRRWPWA